MSKKKTAGKAKLQKGSVKGPGKRATPIIDATIQNPTNSANAQYRGIMGVNREVFVQAQINSAGDQPLTVMGGTNASYPASATQSLTQQGNPSNVFTGWLMLSATNYYIRVEATFMNMQSMMFEVVGDNSNQLTDTGN